MKTPAILLAVLTTGLSACSSGAFVTNAYDDIYYRPGDEKQLSVSGSDDQNESGSSLPNTGDYPAYQAESGYPNQSVDETRAQELTQRYQNYTPEEPIPVDQNETYSYDYNQPDSSSYYEDGSGNTYITNNYYDSDDYYDYAYSSRLRRFHDPYSGCGYYDNYYTNSYWYSYDPWDWGMSIYLGYNFWYPSYYRPTFGFGAGYPYWGWSYSWGYPYWSIGYGYYGYNSWWAYDRGYYDGYWDGYYAGNPSDYYYNSHDGTNHQFGHRQNKPSDLSGNSNQSNSGRPHRGSSTLAEKYENNLLASRSNESLVSTGSFSNSRESRTNGSTALSSKPSRGLTNGENAPSLTRPSNGSNQAVTSRPAGTDQGLQQNARPGSSTSEGRNTNPSAGSNTRVNSGKENVVPEKYQRPGSGSSKYPARTPEYYSKEKRPGNSSGSIDQRPATGESGNRTNKPSYDSGNSPDRFNNSKYPGSYGKPQKEQIGSGETRKPSHTSPSIRRPENAGKPQAPRPSYSKPQSIQPDASRKSSNPGFSSPEPSYRRESSSGSSPKPSYQAPSHNNSNSSSSFSRSGSGGSGSSAPSMSRGSSGGHSSSGSGSSGHRK